jgi:hypothetical protein
LRLAAPQHHAERVGLAEKRQELNIELFWLVKD